MKKEGIFTRMINRWLIRRACFHHDPLTGTSWIIQQRNILVRMKFFCSRCRKKWAKK